MIQFRRVCGCGHNIALAVRCGRSLGDYFLTCLANCPRGTTLVVCAIVVAGDTSTALTVCRGRSIDHYVLICLAYCPRGTTVLVCCGSKRFKSTSTALTICCGRTIDDYSLASSASCPRGTTPPVRSVAVARHTRLALTV